MFSCFPRLSASVRRDWIFSQAFCEVLSAGPDAPAGASLSCIIHRHAGCLRYSLAAGCIHTEYAVPFSGVSEFWYFHPRQQIAGLPFARRHGPTCSCDFRWHQVMQT